MAFNKWCSLAARRRYLKELGADEVDTSPGSKKITTTDFDDAEDVATAWAHRILLPVWDVSTWVTVGTDVPVEVEDIVCQYASSLIWHWRDVASHAVNDQGEEMPAYKVLAETAKNRLADLLEAGFLLLPDGTTQEPKSGAGKVAPVVHASFLGEPIFPNETLERMRDARNLIHGTLW